MLVNLALVDSGDQTDYVYEFCLQNSDWALLCKGMPTMQANYRISTINKAGSRANGMRLVLMDGGKYKDMIAARMRRENGTGAWMIHKNTDLDYAEQVAAEQKVAQKSGGRPVLRWIPKASHAANHYLAARCTLRRRRSWACGRWWRRSRRRCGTFRSPRHRRRRRGSVKTRTGCKGRHKWRKN